MNLMWKEARAPGDDPHIQTPQRAPFVLTTTPQWHSIRGLYFYNFTEKQTNKKIPAFKTAL